MFWAGNHPPVGEECHEREQRPADAEVQRKGHLQCHGPRPHEPTEHRPDRPDGVEAIDDRSPEPSLHTQPVRVLRDVGQRIRRPTESERRRQQQPVRREARGEQGQARDRSARDGKARRPETTDERRRRETGEERPARIRGDDKSELHVAQSQLGFEPRVPREQVREERPVGEEHGRDCDARAPVSPGDHSLTAMSWCLLSMKQSKHSRAPRITAATAARAGRPGTRRR